MIIHLHFHSRTTGVTKSIENIIPALNRFSDAFVLGYGIKAPKIGLPSFFRSVYSNDKVILHTHRINEIIFALLIRRLGGKFTLVFTRHSENKPAGLTCYLMKKADKLVSLSQAMSKNLPYQNTIIRHGINTEIFNIQDKKKIDLIPQENLVSVIGRIRPAKGQLVVLEALASTLRNNPHWGLVLVGKTDDRNYAKEILSIASENDISSQVNIMPESKEIINYYRASNIVVIASESEGFSLVCLEAMSCGLLTIATESVGIHSEVINHGENGFLFPKNDHRSLGLILSEIISKKVYLDPLKIRQTIIDNWSIEKSVSELLKLYRVSPDN